MGGDSLGFMGMGSLLGQAAQSNSLQQGLTGMANLSAFEQQLRAADAQNRMMAQQQAMSAMQQQAMIEMRRHLSENLRDAALYGTAAMWIGPDDMGKRRITASDITEMKKSISPPRPPDAPRHPKADEIRKRVDKAIDGYFMPQPGAIIKLAKPVYAVGSTNRERLRDEVREWTRRVA